MRRWLRLMSRRRIHLLTVVQCYGDMDTTLLRTVTLATALGTGVLGGVFVGFSTFVMPGLDRLAASDAVRAMQAINVTAPRGLAVPLVVSGLGSVALGITAAYHVPRNDALGRVDAGSAAAAAVWQGYAPGWVAMNHVRAALSLASAGLLVAGAVRAG